MADTNITHAKIVANPSNTTWAQAYNAGKLFAVISLGIAEEKEDKDYLNILGKDILDTLEQEYFTLETKDLESIKKAVTLTSEKIPHNVTCSFVIVTYVENVLYLYILGSGKILLKREDKFGTLLESHEDDPKALKNASGYLQDRDVVILETKQFSLTIPKEKIAEVLDKKLPSEIAEHIAPLVHEKDESGAAAIVLEYRTPSEKETEEVKEPEKETEESSPFYSSSIDEENKKSGGVSKLLSQISAIKKGGVRTNLNHPRKVILTIIIVILVVFVGSIGFAVKKQQDEKTLSVFQSVYPQASKKFEEGKSLLGLNEGLAQDSFSEAKKLLEDGKDKLPKNSTQEKQVLDLLNQVNQYLSQSPQPNVVNAKAVDASSSNLLNAEINNQGLYFSASSDTLYFLTSGAVYTLSTDGTSKKSIITNDNDWSAPAGLSNYYGNVYVLDKKLNQILKFAATDSGYSKSDYFSDNSGTDFSKAISMAIDSSVYILSTNGNIQKFNKGASESFTVSGLDKDFSNPTKIFTTADQTYVYILDNGNSRIVVLEKTGKYKTQYQAGVIKSAKDFDVDEKNNKAFVLSGEKVYEIDLK